MSCLSSLTIPAQRTKHLECVSLVQASFDKSLGLLKEWPFNDLMGLIPLPLKILFA